MKFDGGAETVCTATQDGSDASTTATCIPVFEDVADGASVTVTPTF